jgi:predicted exporter
MVVERPEDAVWLKHDLERRRDQEGAPYGRIRLLQDLLPEDQEAKLPLAKEIRKLLLDARGYANDDKKKKIDEHMPPEDLRVLTLADLPVEAARPFTERDGTRGRLVLVEQQKKRSLWDGRYLVAWATALRELRLPDGSRPPLAGRAPVFADMIEVVWVDGPKAVIASFLATLVLVSIAFRSALQRFLSMTALLMGIAWMGGAMALMGMKLNFLNFVAFPITFGNGVDYGVNIMRRLSAETKAPNSSIEVAVRRAIEETGGAVTLCSLTTILGYAALHVSSNRALNSFSTAMVISEITCLLAAVLAMPAMLVWRERRRQARQS